MNTDTNTDITQGTTAEYAYEIYQSKQNKIAELEYECGLLVDRYFAELGRGCIPCFLQQEFVAAMFGDDECKRKAARAMFLKSVFSEEFLSKHKVDFVRLEYVGYEKLADSIVISIGDYEYTIVCPCPQNFFKESHRIAYMGKVKFRVDRIHKSHKNDFVRKLESVRMPTYDWRQCFEAIEMIVEEGTK